MKFETKLNVFDVCFYLEDNKVIKDKIVGITIHKVKDNEAYIKYTVDKSDDRHEHLVFETKQELLDNL